ncbi:MAG: phosphotransferase [Pseudomonadota bacterium]
MTDILALATKAAEAWGGAITAPILLKHRENAVFRVTLHERTAALRLHRAGYQTKPAIEAELKWVGALAERGFPCPAPLRSEDASFVVELPGGGLASAVSWIDATPLSDLAQPADMVAVGRLAAELHHLSDQLGLGRLDRSSWLATDILGPDPRWGCFWEHPMLSAEEADILQTVATAAREELAQRPKSEVGLIHADLLQENIMANDAGLWLIDFDDGGLGYRPYDLGTALIQHWQNPAFPEMAAALAEGYGAPDLARDLPFFTMLRGLVSAGWIISRAPTDDPRQRQYAERAVQMARTWLTGRSGA